MLTLAFWNLKKLPRNNLVAQLCAECSADVVLLAESPIANAELAVQLEAATGQPFRQVVGSPTAKVTLFSSLDKSAISPIHEESNGRLTVHKLLTSCGEILLASVHLPSKASWSNESQSQEATRIAASLRHIELREGVDRTILVGDLNMNPFESGMISSLGFHGVMDRRLAEQVSRTVGGEELSYFYNPMWSLLGDRSPGPPGTFFFRNAEHVVYFWNMFDQFLIRPSLLPYFEGDLRIIETIGGHSLLNAAGIPDQTIGSDHLPITVSLRIEL